MKSSKAYFWGILSRFAPQGVYLITTMILARYLTPDDFGMIGVLSVIFLVANILLDSGLGGSLIQEKEIKDIDCSTICIFNISIASIIYVILYLFSSRLESFFAIEGLAGIVKTISLVFPITAFGIVPSAILKRELKFKQIFISTLIGVILASIISILAAVSDFGAYSLVIYQIVVNAIIVIGNTYFSKFKITFAFSINSLRHLLPFGVWTSLVTIIDTVYENLMTMLTGKYLNVQQAGYLYQAKRLEETMSTSFAMAVGIVAFPVLTRLKEDLRSFREEANRTFAIIVLCIFPLLMTVALFSKGILILLFGGQWEPASFYLKILMFCGLFILMDQLCVSFIKSLGKVRQLTTITIIKRSIGIILLFTTLIYKPESLIYAYLISTIVAFIINMASYIKMSETSFGRIALIMVKAIIPSLLYYCICSLVMTNYNFLHAIVVSILFLVAYYFVYMKMIGYNMINIVKGFMHS